MEPESSCNNCGQLVSKCDRTCPSCGYSIKTYSKILEDQKWKDRRFLILERDKFTCRNCKNEAIVNRSKFGIYKSNRLIDTSIIHYINRRIVFSFKFSVTFKDDVGIDAKANVHTYSDLGSKTIRWLMVYFTKTGDEHSIDLIRTNTDGRITQSYVRELHVHHKYYQDKLCPWEYPDDALETLCWICHEELHANQKVPYLDMNGNRKDILLTPCQRCFGAGYFPQFHHIQGGICFRCQGAQFEEFISERNASF